MQQVPSVEGPTRKSAEPSISVRKQRRPVLAVVAVLMILLGAAGGAWLYLTVRETVEVIVARSPIARGEVMDATQLSTVHMPPSKELRYVPATQLSAVVGQRAAHDVAAGSLIGPDTATSEMVPAAGRTVVGVSLPPGAEPGIPLQVGDRVRVILTEPVYACAADPSTTAADNDPGPSDCPPDVVVPGVVVAFARDDASGQASVSVEVAEADAARTAAGSALGRVAVVLDSREN